MRGLNEERTNYRDGRRRIHRRTPRGRLAQAGPHAHPRRGHQAARPTGTSAFPTSRTFSSISSARRAARRRVREPRTSTIWPPTWAAWASSRTTRRLCMLSVLINTHCCMAAQEARRRAVLLLLLGLRLQRRQADDRRRHSAEGRRRLPGDARRRLRLGEAVLRAHVPAFPRRLRPAHARGPLPQRLRPARHLGRRPREGPGGDLPQGDRGQDSPASTKSRSGATATRPAASCTSTTASRACRRSLHSDIVEPINLGSSELVTINELVDIVEDIAGVKLKRKYNLSAPKGVNGRNSDNTLIQEVLGWDPTSACATVWKRPTPGSTTNTSLRTVRGIGKRRRYPSDSALNQRAANLLHQPDA